MRLIAWYFRGPNGQSALSTDKTGSDLPEGYWHRLKIATGLSAEQIATLQTGTPYFYPVRVRE